jgi:hypothetical protein
MQMPTADARTLERILGFILSLIIRSFHDHSANFYTSSLTLSYRDRELEEELVNRALDLKVDEAQGLSVQDGSEEKCAYCGQSELDVCSPLVVGQYRAEHESHLFLCRPTTADNFYADKTATAVKFCIYGEVCNALYPILI